MNNNQLPNDVYQTPSSQNGDFLEVPQPAADMEMTDEQANTKFHAIEREAVLQAFNQMTRELEMSISGYDTTTVVEIAPVHPVVSELLELGDELERGRAHLSNVASKPQPKFKPGTLLKTLFTIKSEGALIVDEGPEQLHPLLKEKVDYESAIGAREFPKDPEITDRKFFFLPGHDPVSAQTIHMWHYHQTSLVRAKDFTITYKVKQAGVEKNTTFYDGLSASKINKSSLPSEDELQSLLHFSKKYHNAVTKEEYTKPATSRFRFGSKSDNDLAA